MGCEQATAEARQVEQVKQVLQKHGQSRQELIPVLQDVQDALGYLSPEALKQVADYLDLSENEVYGVATFYTQFRFNAPGKHHVKVCQGTACHVRGSATIVSALKRKLGVEPGETTADREFSVERVACLGCCALAAAIVVDGKVHGQMTSGKTLKVIEDLDRSEAPSE